MAANIEQARKRVEELKREIEHHSFSYYVLSRPEISDAEFDKLFRELQSLEGKFPELLASDSPTQKVGAAPSTEFKPVRHRIPMLSLANAMSFDELDKWADRLKKGLELTDDQEKKLAYVCELKIDGLSIALTYKNGIFVEGATRGSGDVGEDVTLNLKTIGALPHKLVPKNGGKVPELLEIRGEVYFPVSTFLALNKKLEEAGEQTFANPRNAASGSLRQKDPRITAKRKLSLWTYFAYVTDPAMRDPKCHSETLALLKNLGLPVDSNYKIAHGIAEVKQFCKLWDEKRHQLDYQTDGVVIKLDERSLWNALGATAHSPRWAIAFKYPPEEAETRVEAVEFEVGRTGAITPVACLTPVKLAGTTVKRASLHNAEQIKRLDVRVGDTVVVRKAGEIIPEVLSVKLDKRSKNSETLEYPTRCPVCNTKLVRTEGEVAFRCPNTYGCASQKQRRLEHWVSREAMDIDGMGEVLIKQLIDAGFVQDPADLYMLTEPELMQIERMGKKSADNILKAIEAAKKRPLSNLIYAFGISHVGASIAELLAGEYTSLKDLMRASADELSEIEGIGPKIGQAIVEFFDNELNQQLVERLIQAHVTVHSDAKAKPKLEQNLVGKIFVLTGTLETLDRLEAEKLIKAHGGKATSSVSKKTDYVVVGANPGSKLARAEELGITVIDEAKLKGLLGLT